MARILWLLTLAACTSTLGPAASTIGATGDERGFGDTPMGEPGLAGDPATDESGPGDAMENGDVTPYTTLSERYPHDAFDLLDPAIVFAADFEDGNGLNALEIDSYTGDTAEAIIDAGEANNGDVSMKLSFTLSGLESRGDASVYANVRFVNTTGTYYVRYYMRYQDGTARPHHANGTRVYAPGCDIGGTAGIAPEGDCRFNTTVDIDQSGRHFFYTYWHEMRSGRCNDGSAIPGCEGDQGVTYYYGNVFKPADQVVIDRYQWHCYEYRVVSNTPNQYDGAQALWIDGSLVGEFKLGEPMGAWLRDSFYTMGEWGTQDEQAPFEGYNFRTDSAVDQVRVSFAIYQEWGTLSTSREDTPEKSEEQAVFYDDLVVATERIGCRVE